MRAISICFAAVLLSLAFPAAAMELPVGEVTASVLNVRRGPGMENDVFWKLNQGTNVNIRDMEGEWLKVEIPGTDRKMRGPKTGYVYMDYIDMTIKAKTARKVGFKISPQSQAPENGVLGHDEWVEILEGVPGGWSKVRARDGRLGWIRNTDMQLPESFLKEYELASARREQKEDEALFAAKTAPRSFTPAPALTARPKTMDEAPKGQAKDVITTAMSLRGIKYRYGGTEPATGFDCSGFTSYVMAENGVHLDRTASQQATEGKSVSRDQIKPGDLVFFDTAGRMNGSVDHAGIYIGNGEFIHAASSQSSGREVRVDSLDSDYFKIRFHSARRVLP